MPSNTGICFRSIMQPVKTLSIVPGRDDGDIVLIRTGASALLSSAVNKMLWI